MITARESAGYPPFALNLGNLTHSEDKKTIFLDLLEKGTIAALRQRVVDHVRANRRIKKLGVDVTERCMRIDRRRLEAKSQRNNHAL